MKLLQYQEELHADEINKLYGVLDVAIQMLKNVKDVKFLIAIQIIILIFFLILD